MLILARKLDEVIHIGENIKIKVVSIQHGMVKLGIDAPDNVVIMRKELLPNNRIDLTTTRPPIKAKPHNAAR